MEFEHGKYYESTDPFVLTEFKIKLPPGTIYWCQGPTFIPKRDVRGYIRQTRFVRLICQDPRQQDKLLNLDLRISSNNKGPRGFKLIHSPLMILAFADQIADPGGR